MNFVLVTDRHHLLYETVGFYGAQHLFLVRERFSLSAGHFCSAPADFCHARAVFAEHERLILCTTRFCWPKTAHVRAKTDFSREDPGVSRLRPSTL
jgi:hypothetical protein